MQAKVVQLNFIPVEYRNPYTLKQNNLRMKMKRQSERSCWQRQWEGIAFIE
jgi:hypothetical protein